MLFLSHSGIETDEAKTLASLLREAGIEVWLDVERLQPGDRWMEELEKALETMRTFAVYVGKSGVHRWVDREVRAALDRSITNPEFRIFPILGPGADPSAVPLFLRQHQWLDLRAGVSPPTELKRLVSAIINEPVEKVSLLPEGKPPFLGLQAFDVEDGLLFYGRDREILELVERLQEEPILAVVGDSGSGKSSLVRAGLIPSLLRGRFHDGRDWAPSWRVSIFRPADNAFRELANALPDLDAYGQVRSAVRSASQEDLREGTSGLYNSIASLVNPGDHSLIVVDQFEELFTLAPRPEREEDKQRVVSEQNRFISSLLEAADAGGDRPVHVVIILRADFYSQCWQHDQLPQRIAGSQYAVQRIATEKLRDIIEIPLSLAGAKAEPGLVKTILEDVGDAPGGLPLLEHALDRLWEKRTNRTITFAAYEAMGRLKGALREHADQLYKNLAPHEQRLAEKIFLRLTQLGEGTEDTRRRAHLDELVSIADDSVSTHRVLKRLADARLITITGELSSDKEASKDTVVDVAHEALIQEWPELRRWIEANRDALRTARRVEAAAREWKQAKDSEKHDYLYQGARLAEAEEWIIKQDYVMGDVRDFIVSSTIANARILEEREARRRAELEAAEARADAEKRAAEQATLRAIDAVRYSRTRTFLLGAAVIAMIGAAGAAWFWYNSRREVLARQLAAQSELALLESNANVDLSTLLAIESMRRHRLFENDRALRDRLAITSRSSIRLTRHDGISFVDFSSDGRRLLTVDGHGGMRVWEAESGRPLGQINHDAKIQEFAFSPDGRAIAAASSDGNVLVWDADKGKVIARVAHGGSVKAVTFSPDGGRIVTVSTDGTAGVWETKTGKSLFRLDIGPVSGDGALALSVNGRMVLNENHRGTAFLYSVDKAKHPIRMVRWDKDAGPSPFWEKDEDEEAGTEGKQSDLRLQWASHGGPIDAVAFSPNGRMVVTSGGDGTVRVWNAENGKELLTVLHDHVHDVRFSPDGRWIATAGEDGSARLWAVESGVELMRMDAGDAINAIAVSSNGTRLGTASNDRTASVWDVNNGRELVRVIHPAPVKMIEFSPDGRHVLTASDDGTVLLSSADAGEEFARLSYETSEHVALSPDGKRAAVAGWESVKVLDASSGRLITSFKPFRDYPEIVSVAFSPDAARIIATDSGGLGMLFDVAGGTLLKPYGSSEWPMAISPDGRRVISTYKTPLCVLAVDTNQQIACLKETPRHIVKFLFSPDGQHLLIEYYGSIFKVWSLHRNVLVQLGERGIEFLAFCPNGHRILTSNYESNSFQAWDMNAAKVGTAIRTQKRVRKVAFSSLGDQLATVTEDEIVQVWAISTGRVVATLRREGLINHLIFSNDGRRLLTASSDGTARVWAADTGVELVRIDAGDPLIIAAFVQNETCVATASATDIRYHYLDVAHLINSACGRLMRNMTQQEWEYYIKDESYHETCKLYPPTTLPSPFERAY